MLRSIFGKKEKVTNESIYAPLSGRIINLEDVPDPVFSQKLMGEGIAIEPTEGKVVAPIDGQIIQIFHTKHAIGIRSQAGIELLLHVGLETVSLNGEGFDVKVKEGQKVKVGDEIITFDLPYIRENAASVITPIIITNSDVIQDVEVLSDGEVLMGQTQIVDVHLK